MGEVLSGTTLLASFLAGVVALLAPCCVSVMLPAYFASGCRSPGRVVGATLVFAAGIAAVIVPIGLGAAAISTALSEYHTLLFGIGGAVMLVAGVLVLAGVKLALPMPSGGAPMGRGMGRPSRWAPSPASPRPAAHRCWPGWSCSPAPPPRGWPDWACR